MKSAVFATIVVMVILAIGFWATAHARSEVFYELSWGPGWKWAYLHPGDRAPVTGDPRFSIQEVRWLKQETMKAEYEFDSRGQ